MKKITFSTIIVLMISTGSVLALGGSHPDDTRPYGQAGPFRQTKLGLGNHDGMNFPATAGPRIKVTVRPGGLVLRSNYPNPFNPTTTIEFELLAQVHVHLSVYNLLGQKVVGLLDGRKHAGVHRVQWNGTDNQGLPVSSGIYIAVVEAGSLAMGQRMTLLK